jgi:CBS domain-containing protein
MSPRAAWRLDSLGYDTYDYVAGKADWLAYGLPYDGFAVLAGSALTTDVPTCSFRDRLGDVRDALEASRFGMLVTLNAEGVVMGRLNPDALREPDDVPVERIMREGPTTVRPSEELEPLVERMRRADVDGILVTSSDGRLLGLLERRRGEAAQDEGRPHRR